MPVDFLENTMVVGTSTSLKEAGESETSLGELLVFLDSAQFRQIVP